MSEDHFVSKDDGAAAVQTDAAPGLVWAFRVRADGTADELTECAAPSNADAISGDGWLWMHFNLADARVRPYLREHAAIPARAVELLLTAGEHQQFHEEGSCVWRRQLRDAPLELNLATDRPRPPVQTYGGAAFNLHLPPDLSAALAAMARSRGTTLYTVLLATFQGLLHRSTGMDDFLVGSPTAGRSRASASGVVGYFINPVVLRVDASGDPGFEDFLDRTWRTVLGAFEHRDYPFPLLAERLHPERDPSRSPIFQVMFVLQSVPPPEDPGLVAFAFGEEGTRLELGGLEFESVALGGQTSQFDLALRMAEPEPQGALVASFQYNTSLFDATTIVRMAGHFQALLSVVAAGSGRRLSQPPLLSAAQRQQLRTECNDTRVPDVGAWCFHELFAAQTERTPEAVALVFERQAWSYRELNRWANRVAHHLMALGVAPEVRVGLGLERGAEMLAGLLGILKAGGAYVPLDPAHPAQRLGFILEDAGVRVLLTRKGLIVPPSGGGCLSRSIRRDGSSLRIVCLDSQSEAIGEEDTADPDTAVSPANLAYVIYTSGSTGQPKGVRIPHAALVNFLSSMRREPGLGSEDVLLAVTTISFDIAGLELFLPLLCGARVVVACRETASSGEQLGRQLRDLGVSVMQATPATWRLLLECGWPGVPGLRVLCGGEALPRALAEQLLPRCAELWNVYGPTETTIWSSCHRVESGTVAETVSIGRPLDNTRISVLDLHGQEVPAGVPGELYVGGAGLASGYANRPGLTAEKLVPDPFHGGFGARLYRSGDLARVRADGRLDCLGRLDHQVKVRGFRIEPGEVEAVLDAHPAVREALVAVREDVPGERQLVAYVVFQDAPGRDGERTAKLRAALRGKLPEYMLPGIFVPLESLPRLPNGKTDRAALGRQPIPRPALRPSAVPRRGSENVLAAIWQEVLGLAQVGLDDNFFDLGGHSLLLARVHGRIRQELGWDVTLMDLLRHPTIRALARHTASQQAPEPRAVGRGRAAARRRSLAREETAVAVIGMAGRFPGARHPDELWRNLIRGKESIRFFSDEEVAAAGVDPQVLAEPGYVKAGGVLDGVELFDAEYFGFSPREAERMDPQHRIFLECAVEALENAGCDPHNHDGSIGVYAGAGANTYLFNQLRGNGGFVEPSGAYALFLGNDKDFLTTWVSYKLRLDGPSVSVQTACSTSLVAVHLACQSLLHGECEMALAGGVSIAVPQDAGYLYQEGMILSPDGHCRAFDARAAGTVRGSGAGIVVLKPLAAALAAGDRVRAVIRGSAINNDGASKVGYTAPSVERQAAVISEALEVAAVAPETISYVEAHGTGTPLGDPIEVEALNRAFQTRTGTADSCALGSVKTNLGHLDVAAGVAGLVKTVLALEHRQIPPSLHFTEPNPRIDFAAGPFYVADALREWPANGGPRRAAVSSFGIGGTNAHVVLEEAPAVEASGPSRPFQLLALSAKSGTAMAAAGDRLAAHLRETPDPDLADTAFTLKAGRTAWRHRQVMVCGDREAALRALETPEAEQVWTREAPEVDRRVAFLFPGQGSQFAGMGRELYAGEQVFRASVDRCAELFAPRLGLDLRQVLYAGAGRSQEAQEKLGQTWLTQPALFTTEYALAQLWESWGVVPQGGMLGHSIGECVAACLAGVVSLEDAVTLVAQRGRLMQELPRGAMLSVALPADELRPLLGGELSLAAHNSPGLSTASGVRPAIEALAAKLAERGVEHRRLVTSHAFHSAMTEPILERFAEIVSGLELRPPRQPYLSNVSGTWIEASQATDPAYWARHLRQTVRFSEGAQRLLAEPDVVMLELGPGWTLTTLVRQHAAPERRADVLPSLRRPKDAAREESSDLRVLLTALGRLWLAGVRPDWAGFYGAQQRRRVALPSYPFERRCHWVRPRPFPTAPAPDVEKPAEAVPRRSGPETSAAFRTPTEEAVAEIWADVLGVEQVARTADFFELGGHSLLATQVASRIARKLKVEVLVREVLEAPVVADLAGIVEQRQTRDRGLSLPSIEPAPRRGERPREGLPLSFAQERLWFLDRMLRPPRESGERLDQPGKTAYNIVHAVDLRGPLDIAVLQAGLNEIVRRHEVLRTSFPEVGGRPAQVIASSLRIDLPAVDCRGLEGATRQRLSGELSAAESAWPFDLSRGPLLRALVLLLGGEEHRVVLNLHHIIADGWSMGVLVRELTTFYRAFVKGPEARTGLAPLPELGIQYADFAVWQRRWLSGEVLEKEMAWWREELRGAPHVLELPLDHIRPPVQSFRGATEFFHLSRSLSRELETLSRGRGATPFMALLAGFEALLWRHSGQEEMLLGTPVANRGVREVEDLIGFFVNTLVMRADLSESPSFLKLLGRVRERSLAAYAHQDLPFEKLVEALEPERNLTRSPLFQVLFVLQNAPQADVELPGLELSPAVLEGQTAKFDLILSLTEAGDLLTGLLEYNSDLFESTTIRRWSHHFATLLQGAVAAPDCRLRELPLLGRAERHQLVSEWNDMPQSPTGQLIPRAFEAQAESIPDAVALVFGNRSLSYRSLEAWSNRLAHRLRRLGVGPEVVVGMVRERSLATVASLLATFKAGGAYVPLDPALPPERLDFPLKETRARVLVSEKRFLGALPPFAGEVLVPAEEGHLQRGPTGRPAGRLRGGNLAYVIYTSGTSGRPKGVMISHRAISRRIAATADVDFGRGDRYLQRTTLSFDVSTIEVFGPLSVGAKLILAPQSAQMDPSYLIEEINKSGITCATFPPSLFPVLLNDYQLAECTSLRNLRTGAEPLAAEVPQRLLPLMDVEFQNRYGTTEATVAVTSKRCTMGGRKEGIVPIGRPIRGARVYLLDPHLQPVAAGVPGVLHVAGHFLSRGYLSRPGRTALGFFPNPHGERPGDRLYDTGDLARYRSDGDIDFLGRLDHQVKIRGMRVELEEIEATLLRHPWVQEAVVVLTPAPAGTGTQQLVGYVAAQQAAVSVHELRQFLGERLPAYMVPSAVVFLKELPRAASGKVNRQALPSPKESAVQATAAYVAPRATIEREIAEVWQDVLDLEQVGIDDNFFDLGGHSLLLLRLQARLREQLDLDVSVVELFGHPSVRALADHLLPEEHRESAAPSVSVRREGRGDLAIVGMAGRFPGAGNLEEFWQNLRDGIESLTVFPAQERESSYLSLDDPSDPAYVCAGGVLEGVDLFDAHFFGYSPQEAETLDPQQRLFLECAWEALERAGHDPRQESDRIGVFAGLGVDMYLLTSLIPNPERVGSYQLTALNGKDFLATRVSYKLGLRGPSVNVQTACSTSLTAVCLAAASLRDHHCDMALAGGVRILLPQKMGYLYRPGMILSPDGHCRAFDAEAQGTVGGNGLGIVVLKRLEDALAHGHHIHAVIKGTAMNNDGADKVGYTAPSVSGQATALREAMAESGVDPATIRYVEAHGTGTEMGDPIEIAALNQAFDGAGERGSCAIGSLKTNIGHLDAAAGVAGLIKTALTVEHGQIPPSLHFTRPNPRIDFDGGPFRVNTTLREWPHGEGPRRAGVSSFGIGGTNTHVVLEQAPPAAPSGPSRPWQLLVLSARTKGAAEAATANLAEHLRLHPELEIPDVAYTLKRGRRAFEHRRTVVCRDRDDAIEALSGRDAGRLRSGFAESRRRTLVFLFPGQGSQYFDMGRELYEEEVLFRREIDRAAEILHGPMGFDVRQILYPAAGQQGAAAAGLRKTALTQPILFAVEHALARLWMSWGLRPEAMIGHSLGEYVAACLAGVFSFEDALRLVARRGQLIQELPPGAMLSLPLSVDEVAPLLDEDLSLAAVNAPELCVVSGPVKSVAKLQGRLDKQKVKCQRLHTSHAFHSAMMEPALEDLADLLRGIDLHPPALPYLSNLTGTWITPQEATDPSYWTRHLRETVRFSEAAAQLLAEPDRVMLEVGPGRTLSTLLRQHATSGRKAELFTTLPSPRANGSDHETLLGTLGHLWLAGVEPDWAAFYRREQRRRVSLPTYPFERRRFWIERADKSFAALEPPAGKKPDMADWFYVLSWKLSPLAPPQDDAGRWLFFVDEMGVGSRLAEGLQKAGCEVWTVEPGEGFARLGDRRFGLDPGREEAYTQLIGALGENLPQRIVHLWSLTSAESADPGLLERMQSMGFYSLLFLVQALGQKSRSGFLDIAVVTNGLFKVERGDVTVAAKASLQGPVQVIPQEYPHVTCRAIDVDVRDLEGRGLGRLLAELRGRCDDTALAWRGPHRWVQSTEPLRLPPADAGTPDHNGQPGRLRKEGVYLITGGLGGIGLALAEDLFRTMHARLVLLGRTGLPDRSEWPQRLDAEDTVSDKIRRVQRLEQSGAEVLVIRADVAHAQQLQSALEEVRRRFGQLDGVFHTAGVPGGGLVQVKERKMVEEVFAPKIYGATNLHQLTRSLAPAFIVHFSSLNAVFGGVGQVDYCAANAFLGALAGEEAGPGGIPVITVDWCEWQWNAWSDAMPDLPPGIQDRLDRQRQRHALSFKEGMEALHRVLASGVARVEVSTRGLRSLPEERSSLSQILEELSQQRGEEETQDAHPRPELAVTYAAPRDSVEEQLVEIWQELLRIDQVGIDDEFLELGGHSLLGLRLLSKVDEVFAVDLPLRTLFEASTVARLSEKIREATAQEPRKMKQRREAQQMLRNLDQLSEEEINALLEEKLGKKQKEVA